MSAALKIFTSECWRTSCRGRSRHRIASDDDNVRDWVWSFPERSESARMIRGTVAWKFSRDSEAAREWLADKDAGWQKDRAMVELARVAKEPGHAKWVLEEITDPALQAEAEEHLRGR